jgi:hypothetical protein
MNRGRSRWLVIGLIVTSLTGTVLGVVTLNGFGGTPSGDLAASSTAATSNLLLALGALLFLGLESAHIHSRRPSRARRLAPATKAVSA